MLSDLKKTDTTLIINHIPNTSTIQHLFCCFQNEPETNMPVRKRFISLFTKLTCCFFFFSFISYFSFSFISSLHFFFFFIFYFSLFFIFIYSFIISFSFSRSTQTQNYIVQIIKRISYQKVNNLG